MPTAPKYKTVRWVVFVGGAVAIMAISVVCYLVSANDLGLTGFDWVIGGRPKMDTLRANTKAIADSFLTLHKIELFDSSGNEYDLVVDYSKSSKIRSLGYRSSFYYYCWDIHLPYSTRTHSGKNDTVVVHLSDGSRDNQHDSKQFRVIGIRLLDQDGNVIKSINPGNRAAATLGFEGGIPLQFGNKKSPLNRAGFMFQSKFTSCLLAWLQ